MRITRPLVSYRAVPDQAQVMWAWRGQNLGLGIVMLALIYTLLLQVVPWRFLTSAVLIAPCVLMIFVPVVEKLHLDVYGVTLTTWWGPIPIRRRCSLTHPFVVVESWEDEDDVSGGVRSEGLDYLFGADDKHALCTWLEKQRSYFLEKATARGGVYR